MEAQEEVEKEKENVVVAVVAAVWEVVPACGI
jgi:hypothetical protein